MQSSELLNMVAEYTSLKMANQALHPTKNRDVVFGRVSLVVICGRP